MKKKKKEKKPIRKKNYQFFTKNINTLFYISLLVSALIFYKLFDIRVNLAGDDSAFIMAGYRFLKYGIYPTWHSPLYSVFLAIPIAVFGVSLPWLKITSSAFLLLSFYFFFKSFKGKIDPVLLTLAVLAVGINSYIAYYSTFTFSEAFYMFVQSLFIFYSFKFVNYRNDKIIHYVYLGLIAVSLYLAKTVGLAGIFSLLVFLAIQKKWRKLIFSFASFSVAYFAVRISKKFFWDAGGSQFSSQLETLMQKHPYQPALGKEDFMGFLGRFVDNSNLYISKHFFRFIGFRPDETITIEPVLTILFYVIIVVALIFAFKRNRYILFSLFYLGAFLGITFITLQKFWDQDRLIIPVFPLMLLITLWGVFEFSKLVKNSFYKLIPYILGILIFVLTLQTTIEKIDKNKDILDASLKGNMYYGFTPDWVNYLKMCDVTGNEFDDTTLVACRKPGMAFIYGKQIYHGIYEVPTIEVDSLINTKNYYYAVPADDQNARLFRREMIRGIFYGVTENSNFQSNKFHYLFELDNKVENVSEDYLVNAKILKEHFTNLFLYSPDELLANFKESGVEYIIRANLRAMPTKKTNRTITTVRRYMQIISMKYPGTFKKTYEIGEDEKAELFQLNYK